MNFSLFLFVLITLQGEGATAHNLIHVTCRKCARNDPNIRYNFCVTSLEAAPESQCANLSRLGAISLNLTRHNVTGTRNYIGQLLKNKKLGPYVRACLQDCFDLYSDAIPALKQAMKDYKSKNYEDANIQVSSVLDASATCEGGFKEKEGVVSPLTKRNNHTFQLSAIALSIIDMLRGP